MLEINVLAHPRNTIATSMEGFRKGQLSLSTTTPVATCILELVVQSLARVGPYLRHGTVSLNLFS